MGIEQDKLARWWQLSQSLKQLKAEEMLLRNELFGHYFPEPIEGTNTLELPNANTLELPNAYALKAKYEPRRKLDKPAFLNSTDEIIEQGIEPDKIVKVEHTLWVSNYKKLTDSQKHYFARFVTETKGTPSMEIGPVLRAKK